MFFISIKNRKKILWYQKKNVQFVMKKFNYATNQWKNGKSKGLCVENVIQKKFTNIILGTIPE